ncbi:MAG: MarR family transcriptional regulator [Actinobacteria bacterium]|nr:MarR family transcriptional regulator [Actinomycetota bacterium]
MAQHFTDEDYRSILALRDRMRSFMRWSEEQARAVGLTPAQHQLLLAVRGHSGSDAPAIGDLAGHLRLRHHSVVGLIDRAEAADLVERVPDLEDRRVVRIRLTKRGRKALEELTRSHVVELRFLVEAFAGYQPPTAVVDS